MPDGRAWHLMGQRHVGAFVCYALVHSSTVEHLAASNDQNTFISIPDAGAPCIHNYCMLKAFGALDIL
jgi:hypothetical protein